MKILNDLVKLSIVFSLLFLTSRINSSFKKPDIQISMQESSVNINDTLLKLFSIGQSRLVSSFLWVKTMLDSDLEHYNKNDLNNWFYLKIKTINTLDKFFYEPYIFGGLYLSIIKDDDTGAINTYERGLSVYPNDFHLNLNAGFHSYFELGDKDRAIRYYKRIANHPDSPLNIPFLIARIMSEKNDLISAFSYLETQLKFTKGNSNLEKKIKKDLYAIKAELDLSCLNKNIKGSCETKDYSGNEYVLINGIYIAKEEWKPFRIKKRATN